MCNKKEKQVISREKQVILLMAFTKPKFKNNQ
jgi:hypothetical protein